LVVYGESHEETKIRLDQAHRQAVLETAVHLLNGGITHPFIVGPTGKPALIYAPDGETVVDPNEVIALVETVGRTVEHVEKNTDKPTQED
jgi:hypothetical protein